MMRMVALEIVVVAVVIFAIAAYLTGRLSGMSAAEPDAADDGLPSGPLRSRDIDHARFGLAFRGYQMGEVDAVLDRTRDELARAEAEAAELRAQLAVLRESAARTDDASPTEQWVTEPWRDA
jgi:DivIVA domain-containing protein